MLASNTAGLLIVQPKIIYKVVNDWRGFLLVKANRCISKKIKSLFWGWHIPDIAALLDYPLQKKGV